MKFLKMRRMPVLIGALAATMIAYSVDITGSLRDGSGEPLISAAVRILNLSDSTFVAGTTTDADGAFTLEGVTAGEYLIEGSYMGYATTYLPIEVDSADVALNPLTLTEKSEVLGEVRVVGVKTQVEVKEDTIQYNADSYHVQPNAVVEDVLRRLPGVEVGSDGSITANGQTVSKILVDGQEFFGDDPTVASRNLPAAMVDKVQVVDRKSDLARITGVDDGENETVINLTVKKGMKNGWFGTVEAGYGTDDRYAVSFNVNRFWNDNQITFLGNANNINQSGFTDSNGQRFRRFGGDQGINTTNAFGVNFNVGNKEILRVGGNVMYSYSDRRSETVRDRQYLFTDSVSYDYSESTSRARGHNIRGDFRLQWKPDDNNTLDFRPRFSLNYNRSWSVDSSLIAAGDPGRTPVSGGVNRDSSRGRSYEMSGQLIYNHNFASRPGRSFSVDARYELSNVHERGDAYSRMRFYLLNDSIDLYDQFSDNHTWSNSLQGRLSWTEPIGDAANGNFLTLAYRARYAWNNADKLTYDHPVVEPTPEELAAGLGPWIDYEQLIFNDDLSNRFRNNYFNQDIRLGFKRVRPGYNLEVGASLVPQMSQSTDLINSDRNIARRWVWNYAPFLRYRLKFSKSRSFTANYNGRSTQPTMAQLQPVADLSDPMRIVIGNPDLNPAFTHNVRLRFNDFDADRQRSIMAMAMVNMTQNSIVSRTAFDATTGAQTTTYENVNGAWRVMAMAMMSMPLRNKAFQFTNHLNLSYNRGVGYNNGDLNVSNTYGLGESMALSFRPDNVELEIRPYYNLQTTHNSVGSAASTTIHTYGGTFNAIYYTPIDIVLSSELTYTGTSGYAAGFNKREWMWNASIAYQFLPGKAATLTLRAYDLLGQKSDITRNVTANYIDDTRYNTLTRYVMLSFTYKFNTFGNGNEPTDRNRPQGPDGPPPGEGGRRGGGGPGGPMGPPPRM